MARRSSSTVRGAPSSFHHQFMPSHYCVQHTCIIIWRNLAKTRVRFPMRSHQAAAATLRVKHCGASWHWHPLHHSAITKASIALQRLHQNHTGGTTRQNSTEDCCWWGITTVQVQYVPPPPTTETGLVDR